MPAAEDDAGCADEEDPPGGGCAGGGCDEDAGGHRGPPVTTPGELDRRCARNAAENWFARPRADVVGKGWDGYAVFAVGCAVRVGG